MHRPNLIVLLELDLRLGDVQITKKLANLVPGHFPRHVIPKIGVLILDHP